MTYALARRLALPLWLLAAAAVLAAAPVLAALARIAGRSTGRPEPVALVRLLLVYVLGELAILLSPARSHGARIEQVTRFVDDLVRTATAGMGVRVELDADPAATAALERHDRPLLVFSRHAGSGDSVLLVHLLLARFGRKPGVVLKEVLTLDPVVGLMTRHLPAALIDGAANDADEIRDIARRLGPDAALLLFPEGGNFSADRRARAIRWLRRNGELGRAVRAERLAHVVAPRPRGVRAALEGAPGADVIFCAHTGLGRASSPLETLRGLPRDTTASLRLWHVPAADLPRDEAAVVAWLDSWWDRLDAWVDANCSD